MVCKEDVLSWFKDLESYKRIDVMYELLNMCVPFEIRFLGTCVEEIGKHTYQELRGPAIIANDAEKLSKDAGLIQGLLEDAARHRVLLYISLLSARNCTCANWFYKNLFRTEWLEEYIVKGNCKDENVQSEFLMLFTMGLYHPAFSFEQKLFFAKMLSVLVEQKEREQRLTSKLGVYYPPHPPGLGYPSQKNVPEVPVKTAMPLHHEDTIVHHGHPPGLPIPPMPPHSLDILSAPLWSRPGFAGTVCGAPEVQKFKVAPFPPPAPISPMISRDSPNQSRCTSPHRTIGVRPAPPLLPPPNPPLENPQLPTGDTLSHSSLPLFSPDIKIPDDELNHIQEEKPWAPLVLPVETKPVNGLRYPTFNNKLSQSFVIEQMQALNLDAENSLHRSNSSSSSSLNQSPPATPTVTPHCPGRGDCNKSRANGVPQYLNPATQQSGLALCETTPPPPPLPTLTNCSVPYTSYPPVPLPSRSIFQYPQSFRPPFTAPQFAYQPSDSYTYTFPHVSYMYSSPQFPPRSLNCYNCGAQGHLGPDCTGQTIEDITQKKTYSLEYTSPLPDADK